jgi:capsular polysaccharide biosynthesis protein
MSVPKLFDRAAERLGRHGAVYSTLRRARNLVRGLVVAGIRRLAPTKSFAFGPPKGLYSEYALVKQGSIPGRIVYESQRCPALAADSLRRLCNLHQDEFQPWPFFWSRRSEVRLVGPSLAPLNDRKRLCQEAMFSEHCSAFDPSYRYLHLPPSVRLAGNWTSVVSCWSTGYYHWWLDALTRLAVLEEFPPDTRILVNANLARWQLEPLQLLGLEKRIREAPEKHLMVENYFFSSPTSMTGCWNPYGIDWLRQRFLRHADKDWNPPSRVFVHRVGKSRGLVNEAEVLEFFKQEGWSIVDPEDLTVRRQIRLFSLADEICGLHGGAFVNTLWSKPGCRILEICADNFLNGVYEGIAEHLQLNHRYLVCRGDQRCRVRVDIDRLKRLLGGDV